MICQCGSNDFKMGARSLMIGKPIRKTYICKKCKRIHIEEEPIIKQEDVYPKHIMGIGDV